LEGDLIRHQGFDHASACTPKRLRAFQVRKTRSDASPALNSQKQNLKSLFFWALKPADLAIEISDFHIAAIHKLASGLHCLRVCIGIEGFVRRYAIVSIN
jgi:hypothetical protein